MSAFTKGNWYVDNTRVIHSDDDYRSIAYLISDGATKDIDDANARLIAAAPEMYDELYEALQLIKGKSAYDGDEYSWQAKSIQELLERIDGKEADN